MGGDTRLEALQTLGSDRQLLWFALIPCMELVSAEGRDRALYPLLRSPVAHSLSIAGPPFPPGSLSAPW